MSKTTDLFKINLVEVEDAEPLAGALFKRCFNDNLPNYPKHFVLLAENNQNQTLTLGYVHFKLHQNMYFGGGMCVNSRALRLLPKGLRNELNQHGGVAFYMLSEAVEQLNDCDAVFGYVGHKGAYKIDLAVGFEKTEHKHLIVYWKKPLSPTERKKTIQQAFEFGPF